jgi:hypothetical protein
MQAHNFEILIKTNYFFSYCAMHTAMRCCESGNSLCVLGSLMQRAMNALTDSSDVGVGNGIVYCFGE